MVKWRFELGSFGSCPDILARTPCWFQNSFKILGTSMKLSMCHLVGPFPGNGGAGTPTDFPPHSSEQRLQHVFPTSKCVYYGDKFTPV